MKNIMKYMYSILIGIAIVTGIVVMVFRNNSIEEKDVDAFTEETASQPLIEIETEAEVDSTLYSVQIGVFSREVPISTFYNISSVNVKKTDNGLYKYSFGIYESKEEAEDSKKQIVGYGMADAFVVVYEVGSLYYLQQDAILFENEMTLQTEFSSPELELREVSELKDLKYKVELGSYFEDVPSEDAMAILELSDSDYDIDRYKAANGETTYIVVGFKSLKDAKRFKRKMKKKGLTTAETVGTFKP